LAQGQEQTVQLQVVQGPGGSVLALVPVSIQGQGPYTFALDTGASQSVVDKQIADQLELPTSGTASPVFGVFGAGQATAVRVEQWRIGEVELPSATIVAIDLPDPPIGSGPRGLLGSDMLSLFGAVTVDYEQAVLVLRGRS
jgi:hypothetical protein